MGNSKVFKIVAFAILSMASTLTNAQEQKVLEGGGA